MTRTTTRLRTTTRAAALGALVLALAAGCGGADDEGDAGAPPADDPGTAQDEQDQDEQDQDGDDASDRSGSDGAASDQGGAEQGEDTAGSTEALPRDADLATEELPITAERAIEIATEEVGGGDLTQIEIDHDDDVWEWELELVLDGTQHELDIDATTGEVTEHETDDDDRDPVVDVTSPLSYDEAIEIALGEEPGRVSGWELDSDDGAIRYQIDIDRSEGGDVEVEIDVETREVRVDD
ncbi:PepSY domain-containing protein [Brachybacterium sp. AOP43-C2-M15]|uniref:PepSY domain-containing protein n=1 Tax=Brachybacterium sp. AOP43-C2-M15 TaxID=3457661 RepID=UPI004033FAAA